MNYKKSIYAVFAAMLVVCGCLEAADMDSPQKIQIFSSDYHAEIKLRHQEGIEAAAEGLVNSEVVSDLMGYGSAKILLSYEDSTLDTKGTDELGAFDFEVEVGEKNQGRFQVDLTLSLRRGDQVLGFVRETLRFLEKEEIKLEDAFVESFAIRFADLVEKESSSYSQKYGYRFDEKLRDFCAAYAKETLKSSPAMIRDVLRKAPPGLLAGEKSAESVPEAESGEAVEYSALAMPADAPRVWQERYAHHEYSDFTDIEFDAETVTVPRYTSQTSFDLMAQPKSMAAKFDFGSVQYNSSTVPLPNGMFQTTFDVVVRFMTFSTARHSKTYTHAVLLNEKEFHDAWKREVLGVIIHQLLQSSSSAEPQGLRQSFAAALEPYFNEEFYEFLPMLARIQVAFSGDEMEKRLAKVMKEKRKREEKLKKSGVLSA